MDNKTIVIDLAAPALVAEYHFGLSMFCISHGTWSEWVSKAEFLRRIEQDELVEARRSFLSCLSTKKIVLE